MKFKLTFLVVEVLDLALVTGGLMALVVVGALGFGFAFETDDDEAGFTGLFSFSFVEAPFGASLTFPEIPGHDSAHNFDPFSG